MPLSITRVFSSTTEACSSVFRMPGSSLSSDPPTSFSTAGTGMSVSASTIMISSSIPSESGALWPKRCSITLDPVDRPPRRLPRVVGRAGAVRVLVVDDRRVTPHLLRALRVAEQVRVVPLLPDEDQVHGRHEEGDELAAGRRAREGIGADAEPAGMVGAALLRPEGLLEDRVHAESVRRGPGPEFRAGQSGG